MGRIKPILLVCILWVNLSFSQGMQIPEMNRFGLLSKIGGDIIHVFSAPTRMSKQSSLTFLALSSLTYNFVTSFDRPINDQFLTQNKSKNQTHLFKPFKNLARVGDVYDKISSINVLFGLSGAMLMAGMNFDNDKMKSTTRLMIESYFIAAAITRVGKGMSGRSRPYVQQGTKDFDFMKFGSRDYRSFPSGHATSAFAMMTVVAKQFDHWWVKIPAYTLAVSVALQRIDSSNHWGADVLAGGAIGYWVGSTLVNRYKMQTANFKLQPFVSGNRIGLVYAF